MQDCDHYQFFLPKDEKCPFFNEMDGTPKLESWSPPAVFIYKPKHKAGNFYNLSNGLLIADQRAAGALRNLFEKAGELLPLPYKDELYHVLNVTSVVDCLDQNKTEWETTDTGFRYLIKRYVFRPERLKGSPIFKIPEKVLTSIFLVEGLLRPEQEFRAIVSGEGLKGLIFKEVWSSENQVAQS